jgi:hypothetical protein
MIIVIKKLDEAKDLLEFAHYEYIELVPTTKPPTENGLYSARNKESNEFMWVYVDGKSIYHFDWEGVAEFSEFIEWIGPIPDNLKGNDHA